MIKLSFLNGAFNNILNHKIEAAMEKLHIEILEISPEKLKFSLSGCDVSLANALRRVLIS